MSKDLIQILDVDLLKSVQSVIDNHATFLIYLIKLITLRALLPSLSRKHGDSTHFFVTVMFSPAERKRQLLVLQSQCLTEMEPKPSCIRLRPLLHLFVCSRLRSMAWICKRQDCSHFDCSHPIPPLPLSYIIACIALRALGIN